MLDQLLGSGGLTRDQVYITNVVKCRPPKNRDPKSEEMVACSPYLDRQISLVKPRVILAVGRVAAQHLLASTTAIGRMRGRWFETTQRVQNWTWGGRSWVSRLRASLRMRASTSSDQSGG